MAVIGIIACSASKLDVGAQAQDLYQGELFKKCRAYVERECDEWFILSACHNLIKPTDWIEPYDHSMSSKPKLARNIWAQNVAGRLGIQIQPGDTIICLAAAPYREWIDQVPNEVLVPLAGLGIGQQLGWLKTCNDQGSSTPSGETLIVDVPEMIIEPKDETLTTASPFTKPGKVGTPKGLGDTAEDRAPVARDHYGRYLLPDPRSAGLLPDPKPWTRVSTLAKELASMYGVMNWETKHAMRGVALRRDLAALAAAYPIESRESALANGNEPNNDEWDLLKRKAMDFSGADERSNLGTAMHEWTFKRNRGDANARDLVLEEFRADFDLYGQMLKQAGTEHALYVHSGLLERIVVNTRFGCAGTFDNGLYQMHPGPTEPDYFVGDLKTGRDLKLGWLEILIQLYLYATSDAMWDAESKQYVPMPPFSQEEAYVFGLPLNGTAKLHKLELAGVGEWVEAALVSRAAKKTAKGKVSTVLEIVAPTTHPMTPQGVVWDESSILSPGDVARALDVPLAAVTLDPQTMTPVGATKFYPFTDTQPWDAAQTIVQPPAGAPDPAGQWVSGTVVAPGVIACGPSAPTAEDMAVVNEFAEQLQTKQAPTPQMQADQAKADERRAVAGPASPTPQDLGKSITEAVQRASVTIFGEQGPELITQESVQRIDSALSGQAAPVRTEIIPLAAGKKACSICRQPGHRKGSPKCQGAPVEHLSAEDSAQLIEAATAQVVNPRLNELTEPASKWLPVTGVCSRAPGHAGVSEGGPGWTLNQDAALWVCSTCGQPADGSTPETYVPTPADEQGMTVVPPSAAWAEQVQPTPRQQEITTRLTTALSVDALNDIVFRERGVTGSAWVDALHLETAKARLAWLQRQS
jgi:hypothetical protein